MLLVIFVRAKPGCPIGGPVKETTDGGKGRVDERVGCFVPKAIAARDDEIDNVGSGRTRPVAEETTRDGGANMADSGSSLQSGNGGRKDEGNGCLVNL